METEARKASHLDVCLTDDVASRLDPGWSVVRLRHEPLPEIALADVDVSATVLGKTLRAPLLISSMTGGTARATEINRTLAAAAQRHGIAFALGSGRAAIEREELLATYAVRDVAPDALVFANLGAVQLNLGVTADQVRRLIADLGADALFLHLNPLQEAVQRGGDTDFRDLTARIAELCAALETPVFAKSVGSGIDGITARRLADAGIVGIDVAGAGGTNWALVEGARAPERGAIAAAFADWGTPTPRAVADVRAALPEITLVASGGIRDGVHVAKALALGADLAGLALPFLRAAEAGAAAVDALIATLTETLRIACFATGSPTPKALANALV